MILFKKVNAAQSSCWYIGLTFYLLRSWNVSEVEFYVLTNTFIHSIFRVLQFLHDNLITSISSVNEHIPKFPEKNDKKKKKAQILQWIFFSNDVSFE